ncbi:sialate O-acetylesterase [Pseudonocardia sp. RS010]|uniref:sialate O-acetylesterase n=1 Tax=Pseudonocardia sp. RS010 TaxID=3385979 RepID=UPI0039A0DDFE
MAFTEITLTRSYRLAKAGEPLAGMRLRFTPTAAMTNAGDTVLPKVVEAAVDAETGELSVALAANTDPDTTPAGTGYVVRELVGTSYARQYAVVIPHDAAGATVDLGTLDEVTAPELDDYVSQAELDALATVVAGKAAAADLTALEAELDGKADETDDAGATVVRVPAAGAAVGVPLALTQDTDGEFTLAPVADPSDVGYDLVAVLGQSNSVGNGENLDVAMLDPTHPRVMQFPAAGAYYRQIVVASDPLQHQQAQPAPACVGFGMTFAREYVKTIPSNRSVLLVPCGRGSTGFSDPNYSWDPAATPAQLNLYSNAVAQIQAALALNPRNRLVAALWHQGEGDTAYLNQAQYAARLDSVIDDLRALFGADLPFLVGPMVPERVAGNINAGYPLVNAAHIDTQSRKPRTFWFPGPTGCYNSEANGGTIHYNAAGQRILGGGDWGRNIEGYARGLQFARANVTGTPPVAPTAVLLTQTGAATMTATWRRAPGRHTAFVVEYNTGSGWTVATRNGAVACDHTQTLTGLPSGATVQVRVSTVNEQGTSTPSPVAALTLITAPAQVTGLAAGTAGQASQPLTWNPAARAASYTLEYKRTADSTWTSVTGLTSPSYTVPALIAATSYDYRVTAVNVAGSATVSATVTASTAAPIALLTAVGTGAYGAYGLRKLKSDYSGSAVKVRRSSDNTTLDIGFTAQGDLDTAALLTFCGANSGFVDTIYDQSGNTRHLAQATAAAQPQIVSAGAVITRNGKPSMQFSGAQSLQGNVAGLYAAGAATTLGVYTSHTTNASDSVFCEGSTTGSQARYILGWWSSGGAPVLQATDDVPNTIKQVIGTAVAQDGALHQVTALDTGTELGGFVDGATNPASSAYTRSGTVTLTRFVLGGTTYGASTLVSPYTGFISEIVTFASALGVTPRQDGQANQKSYYATP